MIVLMVISVPENRHWVKFWILFSIYVYNLYICVYQIKYLISLLNTENNYVNFIANNMSQNIY